MEDEAVAQRQAPSEAVGIGLVAGDHLRTWIQTLIEAIELVPDHVGMLEGDDGR